MDARNNLDCERPGPGSRVGSWVLLERSDAGNFGIVFRAERAGHPEAGVFALKLAKGAEDPRFAREVALLQSLRHSSAPRFEDQGWHTAPGGERYPYVVMRWAQGERLYRWGRGRTSQQVLHVLHQLASVLAEAHALGVRHRDVKGDNVVVSSKGRAVLLDWGAGWHSGAEPVTDSVLPLGTAPYRTPEAVRWSWAHRVDGAAYKAGPEDDVYALGVMGYRLCTGRYPPLPEEHSGPPLRMLAPRELATVSAGLDRLLWACLSEDRQARPTAAFLAAAFKAAAAEPDAAHRIVPTLAEAQTVKATSPGPKPQRGNNPTWAALAATAMGGGLVSGFLVVLAVFCWRSNSKPRLRAHSIEVAQLREAPPLQDTPDGGVADGVVASVVESPRAALPTFAVGLPMPRAAFPGQKKPPCSERFEKQVLGVCWTVLRGEPPCGKDGYEHDGECLRASFDEPRQPTSDEPR